MADLEKIVKIIFAGEDSNLAKTINSVGSGMDKLSGNVERATKPLADLTNTVLKVDAVIAGLAAGALVLAVKEAGKFGDSFNEIATLIDAPADKLETFREDVIAYSRDSGSALEQITDATYQIISATGDWENALVGLSAAERLNTAGKGQLNDTTKLLATSLNAYGASMTDAKDYSDVLFTTVRIGVTNLSELSASLGTVTGLASSAGVPFDDLSAAVGALTGTVGNTSLAVTQMKGILTAVIKPSEQARQEAERLGIAFDQEALAAMGLDKFLQMVYRSTEGNSASMAKLFGRVEGLNGALVLGSDESGKYAEALRQMEERAGAVDQAFEKMADNLSETNQKLLNNLKATLVQVGLPLLDDWGDIANSISNVFKGVSVGFDAGAFDPLISYIEKIAQAVTDQFNGIATALPEALEGIDWAGFLDSLDALVGAGKTVFKELFGDLDLSKPEDLEKAIQKVIDTFEKWLDLTRGIIQGLTPFISSLGGLADKFSELDGKTVVGTGNIGGWGTAINTVAGIIPILTAPLNLLSGSITLLAITKIPSFISSLTSLIPAINLGSTALTTFAQGAAALGLGWTVGTVLRENIPIVRQFGDWIGEAAYNLVHLGDDSVSAMEKQAAHTAELAKFAVEAARAADVVQDLPEDKTVNIDTELNKFYADIDQITWNLNNIENYEIEVTADIDQAEANLEKVDNWSRIITDDGVIIPVKVDSAEAIQKAEETQKKIDEKLPSEKLLEIELQGEIDIELQRIKSSAEVLQTAFEWEAKIEIAEVEAATERLTVLSTNISDMFSSSGEIISDALGVLSDVSPGSPSFYLIRKALEEESQRRSKLLEQQIALSEAEVKFIEAKTNALTSGQGLITIQADGVYPELELVLQKIIELAQVRANEEGFSALLGIT